ncbi:MAG: AraC family transcriptional regulator [Opitutaceae bacterium]
MASSTLPELCARGQVRINLTPGIVRCEPVWQLNAYPLKDFLLWCVLDGAGTASIAGGREIALAPGTALLMPPGSSLGAAHDPRHPLRVFFVHCEFHDGRGRVLLPAQVELPAMPVMISDLATFEMLARQVAEGGRHKGAIAQLRRDLALRLALVELAESGRTRAVRSDEAKLMGVLLAVRENPGAVWRVGAIAAGAGLSVAHAARRVRQLTGSSPQQFVIRARIERARRLMEESSLTLQQIADSLGYTDIYFFHRQFKAVTGFTPGQWRRQLG